MATAGGLYVYQDSGAPRGRDEYPTLIIIHGFVWHVGSFIKLVPLATTYGVRVILLNRRDYPGAVPYTDEERALLPPVPDKPRTDEEEIRTHTQMLETFMRDRAHELYKALEEIVVKYKLPPYRPTSQTGGVVLAGWSFGTTFMTALLSQVAKFPVGEVKLSEYIRRVVLNDSPICLLGYNYPEYDPYEPLFDESIPPAARGKAFTDWITGYYAHGNADSPDKLERRTALQTPPPTHNTVVTEEATEAAHVPAGVSAGADFAMLHGGFALGVYNTLRRGALELPPAASEESAVGDDWRDVELRYVWGERSVWEVVYGGRLLRKEVAAGKRDGKEMRKFTTLCVNGANHFGQWDLPERLLQAFLADEAECDA